FDRLKFDHCKSADGWDYSRVASETYYECAHCAARLTDAHKPEMIAAGKLVYVDADSGADAELDAGNTSRALQIPATYSLFTPGGRLAVMFLEAKHKGPDALRTFVTDELAQPWREKIEAPTGDIISACIDPERAPGTVPQGTIAITAGVDVQQNRI